MTNKFRLSLAGAALALAALPAHAADLGNYGGSIKDGYAPTATMAAAGNCYIRGDVGYSFSGDPDVTWPVTDPVSGDFITDKVTTLGMENTWLIEGGVGCGSGSRGFRGEIVAGYHGDRKFDGEPGPWNPTGPAPDNDPLHTNVTSYTLMVNGYKDLGNFGGFTPYLGAGVGIAYNIVDDVYFTQNPALVNRIAGDRDIAFAWSLMAGVGYQLSHNTVLDIGYRYLDMGKATSERTDSAGFINPRVNIDDLDAHEIKVGLRYHFGGSDCCAYQAMK